MVRKQPSTDADRFSIKAQLEWRYGESRCWSVHALGLEKRLCPVSIALCFGSAFIRAPARCQNTNIFLGTWERLKIFVPTKSKFSEPSPWAGTERNTFLLLILMLEHDPALQFMKSKLRISAPLGFRTSCLRPRKLPGFMKPQPDWIMLAIYLEMQLVS